MAARRKAADIPATVQDVYKRIFKNAEDTYFGPVSEWISTGVRLFDWAIGGKESPGGIPCGRLTEIYGPESVGKTSLALAACLSVIKMGGLAAYQDWEHGLLDELIYKRGLTREALNMPPAPISNLEQGLDLLDALVIARRKATEPTLIVVDTIAGPASMKMAAEEMSEGLGVANEPRVIGAWLKRRILVNLQGSKIAVLILNQIRDKIGGQHPTTHTPGGRTLKFALTARVELERSGHIRDGDGDPQGQLVTATVVKNKVAARGRSVEAPLYFETGFSNVMALISYAADEGVLTSKGGGYVEYKGKNIRRSDLWDMAVKDPKIYQEIEAYARDAFFSKK